MAKKTKPAPAVEAEKKAPWLHGSAPWESYSAGGSDVLPTGLEALIEDGQTEVLVGSIEDVAGGKLKLTHTKFPGDKSVNEQDKMLVERKALAGHLHRKNGTAVPLKESFDSGSEEGGRVVFAADAFYYILLTDDMKYRAMQNGYKFYREDPIFRGVINSLINFIIGKGLKFKARDENPAVNDYLQEFWKLNKMDGKDAEIVKRYLITGEICLRKYPEGKGKVAARHMAVRLIPFWRLAEVLKDPEDAEEIVGFRIWKAAGPYRPQVDQEEVGPEDVLFWKNSTPEEDRGEPPLLACMRPCKWYQDWIQNRVMLNRFRTAIVLFKKLIGATPGKVASVASANPDATTNHAGLGGKVEKRLPKAGTVITHNDKIEYDWKSPQLDASDAANDGRMILLYIACAAQVPEFLLGDASNANFASTFVAENPFIRQIEAYQDLFEGIFGEIFRQVIQHGIDHGFLPQTSTETTLTEGTAWMKPFRRLLRTFGVNEAKTDDQGNLKQTKSIPTRTEVAIDWPSLLHKNQLEDAQTMQIHQNMGLASKQTLRGKAGYEHEVEQERLAEEHADEQDQFEQTRQAELDAAAAAGDGDPLAAGDGAPKGGAKKGVPKGADPAKQGGTKA